MQARASARRLGSLPAGSCVQFSWAALLSARTGACAGARHQRPLTATPPWRACHRHLPAAPARGAPATGHRVCSRCSKHISHRSRPPSSSCDDLQLVTQHPRAALLAWLCRRIVRLCLGPPRPLARWHPLAAVGCWRPALHFPAGWSPVATRPLWHVLGNVGGVRMWQCGAVGHSQDRRCW